MRFWPNAGMTALEAIRRRLLDDEKLFAYLDDVTVVCQPDRVSSIGAVVKPEAIVWRGDDKLSHDQQGVRILGVPIGSAAFVRRQLEVKSAEQETLFHRIPLMDDTQACWLLWLMCAKTRANFCVQFARSTQSRLQSVMTPMCGCVSDPFWDQSGLLTAPGLSPNCHSPWVG